MGDLNMTGSYIQDGIEAITYEINTLKGIIKGEIMDVKEYQEEIEGLKAKIKEREKKIKEDMERVKKLEEIVDGLRKIREERT